MPTCCSTCEPMRRYVDYLTSRADNGIVSLFLDRKETVQLENMAALALVRVSGRGVLPEIRQDRN